MKYKRDEGFRFAFGSPLPVFFTIEELNGKLVKTAEGEARMLDLSPNGMKLNSSLNIPVSTQKPAKVSVRFTLEDTEYKVCGEIVWKEEKINSYFYGIHFSMEEKLQEELISHLKNFAKTVRKTDVS